MTRLKPPLACVVTLPWHARTCTTDTTTRPQQLQRRATLRSSRFGSALLLAAVALFACSNRSGLAAAQPAGGSGSGHEALVAAAAAVAEAPAAPAAVAAAPPGLLPHAPAARRRLQALLGPAPEHDLVWFVKTHPRVFDDLQEHETVEVSGEAFSPSSSVRPRTFPTTLARFFLL